MAFSKPSYETRQAIEEILLKAAAFLDEKRFLEWAELFADDAQYEMLFKSKELRDIDDYVMQFNKAELVSRMKLLPNYVIDTAKRLHAVSNIRIEVDENNATCTSRFTVTGLSRMGPPVSMRSVATTTPSFNAPGSGSF